MAAVTLIGANAIPVFWKIRNSVRFAVRPPPRRSRTARSTLPSCDDHGGASLRAAAAGVVSERSRGVGPVALAQTSTPALALSLVGPLSLGRVGRRESETTEVPVAAVASAGTPPPQEPHDPRHRRDDDQRLVRGRTVAPPPPRPRPHVDLASAMDFQSAMETFAEAWMAANTKSRADSSDPQVSARPPHRLREGPRKKGKKSHSFSVLSFTLSGEIQPQSPFYYS